MALHTRRHSQSPRDPSIHSPSLHTLNNAKRSPTTKIRHRPTPVNRKNRI